MILLVRTWAIYGRTRAVGIFLTVIITCYLIPAFYIESLYLKSVMFSPYTANGRFRIQGSPIIGFDFMIIIAFESLVLALTIIKGVKYYKLFGAHGCFTVLYRDGIIFYAYLLG